MFTIDINHAKPDQLYPTTVTPDNEFAALNRIQQVEILRILKQDIEDLILKNDLITARKAGYN